MNNLKRYMMVILAVGIIISGVGVLAQETLPPTICTQEDYDMLKTGITSVINGLSDNVAYDPTAIMLQARTAIETYQLLCNQMFTNVTHPNGIIGPLVFDGTLYEVTFVALPTEGASFDVGGSITMEEVSGDCGILNLMLVSATNPSETDLFRFGGDCVGLIEVNRSGDWQLSFVKLQ